MAPVSLLLSVPTTASSSLQSRMFLTRKFKLLPFHPPYSPLFYNSYQQFEIDCFSGCPGGNIGGGGLAADGCKIRSAYTTWCVQAGSAQSAGREGDPIFTNLCATQDSQRFNFLVSPFNPVGRGAGQNGDSVLSVSGAVSDSDSDGESKLSTLIRNSYIMIGLLAIVLIMLLLTTLIAIAKGMFKGKAKYKTLPKHDY